MSEYQYYEFRTVDQALDKAEMAALRQVSTRAEITSHGFVNSYEWGDLKADPTLLGASERVAGKALEEGEFSREVG